MNSLIKLISKIFFSLIYHFDKFFNLTLIIFSKILYKSFHPDSYIFFKHHSEFKLLKKSFIKGNFFNNSGDLSRLWTLILNIKRVCNNNVKGDFAELGVWRGNTSSVLAYYAYRHKKKCYLFDTFNGFSEKDLKSSLGENKIFFRNTSIELVKKNLKNYLSCCEFVVGRFPDSLKKTHKSIKYSIVSIDCDLYLPIKSGLEYFYPRLSPGGIIFIHDYSSGFWDGAKKATDDFCIKNKISLVLLSDKSGTAVIVK